MGRLTALGFVALLLTSCGSNNGLNSAWPSGNTSPHSGSVPLPVTSSNPPNPGAAPADATGFHKSYVTHYTADDGTRLTVTFTIYEPIKTDDATYTSWFPTGAPCEADSQRDAVFPGTLTITTDTPGFNASLDITMSGSTPVGGTPTLNFGIVYSNGPRCSDLNGASPDLLPLVPHLAGIPHWGPNRLEFVVHNVYSPSAPLGDPTVVQNNDPTLSAFEGQPGDNKEYKITSTTAEIVYESLLPTVRLRLDQL